MVKVFSKFKKNNKGVSLVEVLVTLAMVVIMAGPLINSFLNAMGVNSNARTIQNGTTVAQDLMEEFEVLPIEQLCVLYGEYLPEGYEDEEVYAFTGIPIEGPNGEDFLVDITLDPTSYQAGGDKINVNNVQLPGMSSLYASDSIMLYSDYVAADNDIKNLFVSTGALQQADIDAIDTETGRRRISKYTHIFVQCDYVNEKYYYDIDMTMTYIYDSEHSGTVSVSESRKIEDVVFTAEQTHNIYLVCPVFDIYTWAPLGGVSYGTDSINIEYKYMGLRPEDKKDVYFYLAEQEAMKYGTSVRQRIKPERVFVTENSLDYSITHASKTREDNRVTTIMLNTNIGKSDSQLQYDLTYVNKVTGNALYDVNVQVRLARDNKVIAEFSSSK